MNNYIPEDFFEKNKTTVYATKKTCMDIEGSAIDFDQSKIDINISIIENGKLVESDIKRVEKITTKEEKKNKDAADLAKLIEEIDNSILAESIKDFLKSLTNSGN